MLDCPRIRYEHDYWNLVIQEQEQYKKEIWDGCMVCIFHSPAHLKAYSELYPDFQFKNVWFQPSAMNVDKIWSGGKEDVTIWVGAIVIHKGVLDVLQMMMSQNEILHVYGTPDSSASAYYQQVMDHPNLCYHGTLPYIEMLSVFAHAKRFIFLPVWVEPFGRVVAEARLSGCELTLNNRVGAISYDWWNKSDDEFKEMLRQSVSNFWKVLDLI
jgi:glycosyltransferase involved in cell wall biosynthesis